MNKNSFYGIIVGIFCVGLIYGARQYGENGNITPRKIYVIEKSCNHFVGTEFNNCMRKEFKKIVRPTNLAQIMDVLNQYMKPRESYTEMNTSDCHSIAHIVGGVASFLPGVNPSSLIASCGSSCGYGCTHGVVMGTLQKDSSAINHLETLCQQSKEHPVNVSDQVACFHGLGHGLAEYARYNIKDALVYCGTFSTRDAIEECGTGVFMEVYSPVDSAHEPLPIPVDIFSNCEGLTGQSEVFCKRMMISSQYFRVQDIISSVALCQRTMKGTEHDCVLILGADVYFIEHKDIDKIIHTCHLAGMYSASCIQGAVLSSLSLEQNTNEASEICKKSMQNEALQCQTYLRERAKIIGKALP
jgi:hypothetical protein